MDAGSPAGGVKLGDVCIDKTCLHGCTSISLSSTFASAFIVTGIYFQRPRTYLQSLLYVCVYFYMSSTFASAFIVAGFTGGICIPLYTILCTASVLMVERRRSSVARAPERYPQMERSPWMQDPPREA